MNRSLVFRPRHIAAPAVAVGVLLLWGQIIGSAKGIELATTALILCLCAQGLNIQYGLAGQLSIAQGAVWGSGAYAAALLESKAHVGIWLAFPVALAVGAFFAVIIGAPSMRVLGNYYVIVTFALASIFAVIMDNLTSVTGGDQGIYLTKGVSAIGPIKVGSTTGLYYLTGIAVVLGMLVAGMVHRSRFGARLVVAADNLDLALSLGLRVRFDRVAAFALGGGFAGVAGVLYAYSASYVQPTNFGTQMGIQMVLIVVLGGTGSVLGPVVGSIVTVFLPDVLPFSPFVDQCVFGALLVLVILALPRGVVPTIATGSKRLVEGRYRRADASDVSQVPALGVPRGSDSERDQIDRSISASAAKPRSR